MSKVIIGFETSKEFKERVIKACKNYRFDGGNVSVNLSMFCRIAVTKLLNEVEKAIKPTEGKWSR